MFSDHCVFYRERFSCICQGKSPEFIESYASPTMKRSQAMKVKLCKSYHKDSPIFTPHGKIRHNSHFRKRFAVILERCRNDHIVNESKAPCPVFEQYIWLEPPVPPPHPTTARHAGATLIVRRQTHPRLLRSRRKRR